MATLAAIAARRAATLTRISTPTAPFDAAKLVHRRRFSADSHGDPKVDIWKDPMSPSKWKDEHFVIISLAGWGIFIYGTYKLFTRGKGKDKTEEKPVEALE